jgi:hypothetical protein
MDRFGRNDVNKKCALIKIRGNFKDWWMIYSPIEDR